MENSQMCHSRENEELKYEEVEVRGNMKLSVSFQTPPKFSFDDQNAISFFQENGYAVFHGVLGNAEIEQGINLFWNLIERETNNTITRNNPASWIDHPNNGFSFPGSSTGIMREYGIGQSEFLWYLRGIDKISKVFSMMWNDDDLITSFDGCGLFRPPELSLLQNNINNVTTKKSWFHVDQNGKEKPDLCCIQSLVNLIDSNENDGGLLLLPKSHLLFNKLFDEYNIDHGRKIDFIPVDRAEIDELWNENRLILKCSLDKGDMIIWDSRTIHCSHPAKLLDTPLPPLSQMKLRRLVAYICMSPAKFVEGYQSNESEDFFIKRINAFFNKESTNHWPDNFIPYAKYESDRWVYPKLSLHQKSLLVGKLNLSSFSQLFPNF